MVRLHDSLSKSTLLNASDSKEYQGWNVFLEILKDTTGTESYRGF